MQGFTFDGELGAELVLECTEKLVTELQVPAAKKDLRDAGTQVAVGRGRGQVRRNASDRGGGGCGRTGKRGGGCGRDGDPIRAAAEDEQKRVEGGKPYLPPLAARSCRAAHPG